MITLCPVFFRTGISLAHPDPSAQNPWTSTILVVVAFVVAMPCDASGSIKVLLSSVVAKPAYGVKVFLLNPSALAKS